MYIGIKKYRKIRPDNDMKTRIEKIDNNREMAVHN